jgi:hypothetical protein
MTESDVTDKFMMMAERALRERDAMAKEIERVQEAKRRALAIADERSKENVALRKALEMIAAMDPWGKRADDLGRAARTAREALTSSVGTPST